MDKARAGSRRQIAKVKSLAHDQVSLDDSAKDIDKAILGRIRKCLDRANHPNTPEAEAQAALRMSSRLMEQHNVNHADIIAAECANSEPSTLAGQSTVSILHHDETKKIIYETWVSEVENAITVFFDCESYSTQLIRSLDIVFYGIAANTVAAAMSFEMVHNLVQDWSVKKKTGNKNSYRLGVADGLNRIAKKEKRDEEQRARESEAAELAIRLREEQEQRKREVDRLSSTEVTTNPTDHDSLQAIPSETVRKGGSTRRKERATHVKIEEVVGEKQANDTTSISGAKDLDHSTKLQTGIETRAFSPYPSDDPLEDSKSDGLSAFDDYHDIFHDAFSTLSDIPDSESDLNDNDNSDTEANLPTFKEDEELVIDLTADFDDELHRHMPQTVKKKDPEAPSDPELASIPVHKEDSDEPSTLTQWKSASALILFRQNAQKIAEDYLKSQGTKLTQGRKRDRNICDWDAFAHGVKDSKKIDVKRRRIEGC